MACTLDFRGLVEGFGGKTFKRKREEAEAHYTSASASMEIDEASQPIGEAIGGGVGGESRQANHREAELWRRDLRESLWSEMEADEEAQGFGDSGEEGLELRGEEEEGDKEGVQGENNGAEGDNKAEQGGYGS